MAAGRRLQRVPDTPQRVVLYVRVSALMGREGDDFHSPQLQVDAMRRATSQAGLKEAGVVEDIDVSGRSFSRAGLDKVRKMVEAGQVDVVGVFNLSRLGRNTAEALAFIRWLREHDVAIMSVQEQFDDSPEGQFQLGLWLGMAELYGAQVGRSWKAVISKRAREGLHHGGAPLGYRRSAGQRVMEPDPVMGPIMAAVFRRFAGGESTGALMKYVAATRGKPISREAIRTALANPVYAGKVVLWPNKTDRTWSVVPVFMGPGLHEPLVDEATFKRVHKLLEANSKEAPRHLAPSHSLVRLVFCGVCNRHLRKSVDHRGGKATVVRLHCPAMAVYVGTRACVGVGAPHLDDVETYVLEEVTGYIAKLKADPTARAERRARAARAHSDIARVERELSATRQEMAKLTKGWQQDIVPDSVFEPNMAELKAAEVELSRQVAARDDVADEPTAGEWIEMASRLLELWPEATPEERNRALRRVVKSVVVSPPKFRGQPSTQRTRVEFL